MKLSTGMKKALSMFLTLALVVSGVYVSESGKAAVKEYSLAVTQGQKNSVKVEVSNLATEPAFKVVPKKVASGTSFTCAATTGGVEVVATAASGAEVGTYDVDVVANVKKEVETVVPTYVPGKDAVLNASGEVITATVAAVTTKTAVVATAEAVTVGVVKVTVKAASAPTAPASTPAATTEPSTQPTKVPAKKKATFSVAKKVVIAAGKSKTIKYTSKNTAGKKVKAKVSKKANKKYATVKVLSNSKIKISVPKSAKKYKGYNTTVTLKGGKTVKVKIYVQNKTTKAKASKKKVTVKKNKTAKVTVKVTAQNKKKATTDTVKVTIPKAKKKYVTYKSAKVSKGKVVVSLKAKKKKATVPVTIKVGSKKVKVSVKVK